MSDRLTQIVLGTLGGIFIYCLIVLRTIRGGEEDYVPSLAVLFGVVFAIGGVTMLIFFIHHIASSIQASSIIESVTRETLAAIDRLLPAERGDDDPAPEDRTVPATSHHPGSAHKMTATRIGYIQSIDVGTALRVATKHEAIVRLERGVGEFVVIGTELASIETRAPTPGDAIDRLEKVFNTFPSPCGCWRPCRDWPPGFTTSSGESRWRSISTA
jgi:uncharacterized membrane protein